MRKHKNTILAIVFLLSVCLINEGIEFVYVRTGLTRIILNDLNKCDNYECVIMGQSHSAYGIDPEILHDKTGLKTMNMAIGGQYMLDMYYYLQEVYDNNDPEVIVLDMDFTYFENVPKDEYTYANTLLYYEYPNTFDKIGYSYRKLINKDYRAAMFSWNIRKSSRGWMKKNIKSKLSVEYRCYNTKSLTNLGSYDTYKGCGFIYRDGSYRNTRKADRAETSIVWNNPDYEDSVEYFNKIVKLCKDHGSQVILMSSPINSKTLIESKDEYDKACEYMQKLADNNGLIYYNFNLVKPTLFSRREEDYYDCDGHFYGDAADRYSRALAGFLSKVIDGDSLEAEEYFYSDIYDMYEAYLRNEITY